MSIQNFLYAFQLQFLFNKFIHQCKTKFKELLNASEPVQSLHRQVPTRKIQIPTGSIQIPTGTIQVPPRSIQVPPGKFQIPTGTIQIPRGKILGAFKKEEEKHLISVFDIKPLFQSQVSTNLSTKQKALPLQLL